MNELKLIDTHLDAQDHITVEPLDQARLHLAKAGYTTRRVPLEEAATLLAGEVTPRAGDLVLARVERLRQHSRIELATGRRAYLHPGDEIIVCYGHRYAPDQFESVIPDDLSPCHLVAAGGIASRYIAKHGRMKNPTEITPLGILGDRQGRRLNLADWAIEPRLEHSPRPFTVAVVGTSMNAGKTTSAAHLIRGLARSGLRVGAAKITGTGAGGDVWLMTDSGASRVVDFTDAGLASTYLASLAELERVFEALTEHLCEHGCDAIVLEVADGLFQQETSAILRSERFRAGVDGVLFAAGDAMGAVAGSQWLAEQDLPVIAVSGALTASPLATREAEAALDLPVLGLADLSSPEVTAALARELERGEMVAQAV